MMESLHSCLAVCAPTAAGARPGGGAGQLVTVTAMPGCWMPDAGRADRHAIWYLTSA